MFRITTPALLAVFALAPVSAAKAVDADEIKKALNGLAMNVGVKDDTTFRLGRRYGTRHHVNGAVITVHEVKMTPAGPVTVIELDLKLSGSYVRYEYGALGGKKTEDESISERVKATFVLKDKRISIAGDAKREEQAGSGDGRNMMYERLLQILEEKID